MAGILLFTAAFLFYPYDEFASRIVVKFQRRAGAEHVLQEYFALFRPLGKGDNLALIALLLGLCGMRRRAGQILLSLLLVSVLVWPVKLLVGRERPNEANTHSFPSGDTATIAAFCVPFLQSASLTPMPAAAVAISSVAAGRVFDGKHYPSDVCAGAAFGLIAGAAALLIARRFPHWVLRRRLMALLTIILLAVRLIEYLSAGHNRYFIMFLGAWGPALVLVVTAFLLPVFIRKYRWFERLAESAPTRRSVLLLIGGLILALYFFIATRSTLWDRDEPRFAKATLEMVESGNYLYPTFNGELRPDKPILIYWLMSIPVRLLGPSELACRFVAPLATLIACLLTFWLGRRLLGPEIGCLAAAILATTPLMLISGTAATTDALLLVCVMGALCAFGNAVVRGPRSADTLLLALALGAALLTKGPVGLAVPALVVVTAYLILLRYAPLPPRYLAHLGIAAAAGCALFLLWALPANAATGGEFAQRGIGRHVVQRILQPLESHGGKSWLYFFYYLPATLLTFFPWTLYLPLGLAALQGEARRAPRARIVLWAWIVPIAIMMSLVATKLPHYILPVWPALAYAVALGVRRADQRILSDRERRWLKAGPWLFMPVGMLTGLALVIPVWISPLPGLRGPAFTVGLVVLAMTGAAFYMFRRRRHGAAAMVLVSGMLLIQLAIPMSVLPAVETFKISPRVAKVVAERIGPDVPVATYRYGEPSLNFYLKRRVIETLASDNAVVEWTMRNAPGVLIIPVEDVLRIVAYAGPIDAKAVATVRGYNYSKGHWVDLMVARRDR